MEGAYQADLQYRARAASPVLEGLVEVASVVAVVVVEGAYQADLQYRARAAGPVLEGLVEAASVVAVVVVVVEGEKPP